MNESGSNSLRNAPSRSIDCHVDAGGNRNHRSRNRRSDSARNNHLTVVAQCSGSGQYKLEKIALVDCATIPISVIHSVERTSETLVLDDAVSESSFATDSYIQNQQTRSLLCLPILNQSQLIGILYLENNLSAGVFTGDRLQVLNLLMTQAAVSLENARSYKQLADYTESLEQRVEEQTQALQQEIAERKQAEEALQRSETKFRNIFENSQVGIFRNRICDGLILDANQRFANLYGFDSPEEMIGLESTTSYYVNSSDRQQAVELLKRDGEVRSYEVQMRKRDGTVFWGLFSSYLNAGDDYIEGILADISDHKQAETALRQSEANYRNLLQTANSVIIRYDPQGRIHYINDYGVKLLGYEEHEILRRSLFETIIPEAELSGRDMRPFVRDLLRNPQSYPRGEGENLCRDGRRVWMEWSNQAILNEQGELIEILSVGNDTTRRRQAEEALQRSEAKFRTIFENSQVGIFRSRLSDGLLLDANQRHANLFGFDSPEEIIGLEYTTGYYVNPIDRQHAIELLKQNGEVRSYEAQMRKRDGTVFWGLFSFYLNAADDYIEGVIADISDRKQAEVALQTSEERLRLALTASKQGLYDMNLKTEEIVVNPEYALMLGYNPATFHETKSRWIESLHPDDRESMVAIYNGFITGEDPNYQVEYRLRTRNGQWKWILSVGKIVTWNESGEPIRALGVVRDIDDCKRAEAASIIEERNRMAREIHDTLAQAFTGILAQVGAAKQVLTDDAEATEAHLDLIKELARTGLIEARRSVVALRPQLLEEGSLQSALHRLVAQLRTAALDTTLYDEIEGTAYALPAEVESNLLRIGQEALTNATKHANADEIRVKLIYDRDQVCLRVKDNGQGFGVGCISCSKGFGLLGMSERAERIGAQLTIKSQPGQGAEIIVTVDREASR
ncbi:MAG: PAS domain S-box protein [Leptolyngbyaceae cyanobacterium SM1_3_5]|nr:PAS domain S-box protein [Leptolyngbyaceae cyanobacterium SM1_3_5]